MKNVLTALEALAQREMNAEEALKCLTYDINRFWSWGVSKRINYKDKGLLLKVSGHHHKGWVFVTLSWVDLYQVHLISNNGVVKESIDGIFFTELADIIDKKIEYIDEYSH